MSNSSSGIFKGFIHNNKLTTKVPVLDLAQVLKINFSFNTIYLNFIQNFLTSDFHITRTFVFYSTVCEPFKNYQEGAYFLASISTSIFLLLHFQLPTIVPNKNKTNLNKNILVLINFAVFLVWLSEHNISSTASDVIVSSLR